MSSPRLGNDRMNDSPPGTADPKTARRHVMLIALAVIGLTACTLLGSVWLIRRSARQAFIADTELGRQAYDAGRYAEAFALFLRAAEQHPEQPVFLKAAAQAALALDHKPEAELYARRAWDAGLRDEELMALLLIDAGRNDPDALMVRGEQLIAQLSDEGERRRMRARLLVEAGRHEQAAEAFRLALDRSPTPAVVAEYGQTLAYLHQTDRLIEDLQRFRARDLLNAEGYRLLALSYSFHNLNASPSKRLDPLVLLDEARKRNAYDDRLRIDHSLYLAARLRLVDALQTLPTKGDDDLRRDAGLLRLWYVNDLGNEVTASTEGGRIGEALTLVAKAISDATRPLGACLADLTKAERLFGTHPVLSLFFARLLARDGQHEAALARYASIQGLLAYTPTVMVEEATTLAALHKNEAAVAMIMDVHRLHGLTKRSLLLLAQLTGNKPNSPLSTAIGETLTTLDSSDPELQSLAKMFLTNTHPGHVEPLISGANALSAATSQAVEAIRNQLVKGDFTAALEAAKHLDAPAGLSETLCGLALQGLERHAEALTSFAAARAAGLASAAIDVPEATSALQLHRWEVADIAAQRAISRSPTDADPHRLLVLSALDRGDVVAAHERILAARHAGAQDPQFSSLEAVALALAGKLDDAITTATSAVAAAPADDILTRNILVDLFIRVGRIDEAKAILMPMLSSHANHPGVLSRVIKVDMLRGDHAAALNHVAQLRYLIPDDADIALLNARILAISGDATAAQRELNALPPTVPAPAKALVAALIQRWGGRPGTAIHLLEPHLSDPAVAVQWAYLILEQGIPTPLEPTFTPLRLERDRWISLAFACESTNRWADAADLTKLALRQSPQDPALLNNWAWYALHLPDANRQDIENAAHAAWASAPDQAPFIDTYGEVLLAVDKAKECLVLLDSHSQVVAADAQLLHHRGRALLALGKTNDARDAFSAALAVAQTTTTWSLRETRAQLEQRLKP